MAFKCRKGITLLIRIIGLVAILTGAPWARESLLVLRPQGDTYTEVVNEIARALESDFFLHEMILHNETTVDTLGAKIAADMPAMFVLMDNHAITLCKEYQQRIPEASRIPSISCMVAFVEDEIQGLANAIGIAYETPLVTSVVDLRYIATKTINRVGIIHRAIIQEYVQKNISFCEREHIKILTYTIAGQNADYAAEVKKGFRSLIENDSIDALWIPNDPALLQPAIISKVWIPLLNTYKVPAIVGVENLVTIGMGTFAVVPDHRELGRQVAEQIIWARKNQWQVKTSTVEPPVAVIKLINIQKARENVGIRGDHLVDNYRAITPKKHLSLPGSFISPLQKNALSLAPLFNLISSTGSFLDLDLNQSPMSMTVIDREMIRVSGARTITELLELFVPGFQYLYNKYNGTIWGMRGITNDRNTKFIYLVDGHKLNMQSRDGFRSEVTLGLLNDIERVEVLRGPAGLVYGSGAIAGIINVITRKETQNVSEAVCSQGSLTGSELDSYFSFHPTTAQALNLSIGFRRADGLDRYASRLYGKASGPYPSLHDSLLIKTGVPTDGTYGSTPGNFRIGAHWQWRDLEIAARFTHQVETAGGWFITDPYPDYFLVPPTGVSGSGSTRAPNTLVDGKTVTPDDPFWSNVESFIASRRQYSNDNLMAALNYKKSFNDNELKMNLSFDKVTNRYNFEHRAGDRALSEYNFITYATEETFGEQRINGSALFLLRSIPRLQSALGIEAHYDRIGEDFDGKNERRNNPNIPIVSGVDYKTFSVVSENLYDLTSGLGLHLGGRFDVHTRARLLNGKAAVVWQPAVGHSIKAICQSASNNGSADDYEYNRNHFNRFGELDFNPHYKDPTAKPTQSTDILPPAPTLTELHNLKPERVFALELTSTHSLLNNMISLSPSVSGGRVLDLFAWSQSLYRTVNTGRYDYFNLDVAANLNLKKFKLGISHTYQRPRVDVEAQKTTFRNSKYIKNPDSLYTVTVDPVTGDVFYEPNVLDTTDIDINIVKSAITVDGSAFLNLATNLSKIYVTYQPQPWVAFHSNIRLFWGLPGRKSLYQPEESAGFQYWGIWEQAITKWNAGATFFIPHSFEVSFFVYDILGVDHGSGNWEDDPLTINTLRWHQMADQSHKDITSTDQRSFRVRITKAF
jgi:outer membrane receptor protein involved in Fe transport